MNAIDLTPILAEIVDATTKGYPLSAAPLPLSAIGAQGWSLLGGDLPMPLAVIRDSALAHNHAWMRDFTAATGVLLAPHGKTTMAPQIFAQQLAAGAWGMTVANVQQLGICARFGVRRVLMANQLLGALEVRTVIGLLRQHPDLEFHFLVDSLAQLAAIEAAAATDPPPRRLTALIELGVAGGRTGARTHDAALALARAIGASRSVALSGLECYEGLQISGDAAQDALTVGALMRRVKELAIACDRDGLFAGRSVILTAGGSAAFDIVARELPMRLSRPVLTLLRSGCYVTHDSGNYERLLANVKARSGGEWLTRSGLQPALEVWSRVQSCPEPALAILTLGKRDASYDIEMPIALKRFRPGAGAAPQPVPAGWTITAMNDQHAYLRCGADEADPPQVGDLIGCGISHPCTTFDKWRVLFTVDDAYRVTGAIRTYF
ncbi:MAG TPA: amino acid deaminase [Caldimonas sp.]|jgi:D-serine dehydratase|nr:amino acid deaminase [Caldimonas sp.]